jgi:hypothetical protein
MRAYASLHLETAKRRVSKKRYPYQRIFADLRFRIDSGKLHCCAFAKLRNAQLMKTERSEGHHEAVKALALSELGGDGDYPDLEFGHAGLVLSGQQ